MEHIVSVHDLFLTLTRTNRSLRLQGFGWDTGPDVLELNDTTNLGTAQYAHAQTI
jgi:hypothetical protein